MVEREAVTGAGRAGFLLGGSLVAVLIWVLMGPVEASAGPSFRSVALVYTDESPAGSLLEYDDGSNEAASFLGARDSVTVVIPWDMSSRAFLRLYHLENNRSAQEALAVIGASSPEAVLPEGTRLRFSLTPAQVFP